uniref:Uncharacterized protein n=2 Tax=Meloidogyne TaxID=189290 RepID=A0A6V7VMK2_MELEN|nr:unnamed protein product [Meloidogyne enterolobii]
MPVVTSRHCVARLREETRRKLRSDGTLADVSWILSHYQDRVTTQNRANLCRDYCQLLNRYFISWEGLETSTKPCLSNSLDLRNGH